MVPDQNDSKAKTFQYTILDYSGSESLFQVLNVRYNQKKREREEKEGRKGKAYAAKISGSNVYNNLLFW